MRHCLLCGCAVGLVYGTSSTVFAQAGMFRAWIETPDSVIAGESFTATIWVSFESDTIDLSEAYFGWISTDVELSSGSELVDSISGAYDHFTVSSGEVSDDSVRGIFAWQVGAWGFNKNVDFRPAVQAFAIDIATQSDGTGDILLSLTGTNGFGENPDLGWYLDYEDPLYVDIETPGVSLFVEDATVHVIPSPAPLGLLCSAGLAASRRRR